MSKTPQELFGFLDSQQIKHQTFHHKPIFTAEEAQEWKDQTPGLHCKNLFLDNKSGVQYLVTMPAFERADLKLIASQLNSGRLSFVKSEKMLEVLGVAAGHATPFAFINESSRFVQPVLDKSVIEAELINVHPLINSASTVVSGKDLVKFLEFFGLKPIILAKTFV